MNSVAIKELHVGDRVKLDRYVTEFGKVTKRANHHVGTARITGTVVFISPRRIEKQFVVVDLGNYRETFWVEELL